MTRLVLLALALVAIVSLAAARVPAKRVAEFQDWKAKYGKSYKTPTEEAYRLSIFHDNMNFIESHDAEAKGYTVGMNQFGDLTVAEFSSMVNGYRMPKNKKTNVDPALSKVDLLGLPASVDWRTKNAVTPIKNQGQCGSCWSFSTTGSTEGAHALATGNLVSLSEQNLIDCSTAEGNQGCNGGLMDDAFQYIIKNNGIDTEASYPYQAQGPLQCRFKTANIGATLTSFKDVQRGSELALQAASATIGPVSVAIDASHNSFQFYQTGVYYEPACSTTQLDHGVLVVGYGNDSGSDYWIVKNSWGTTWGQQGYIWMSRNRNNNCGIATQASYPIAGSAPPTTNSGPASNSGPAASGPAASNSGPAASGPAASHSGPASNSGPSNSGPSNSGPAASHTTSASASSGKTQSSSGKTQSSSGQQASSGSSGNNNSSGSSNNSSGGSSGASSGASSGGSSGQGSSGSSGSQAPRRLVNV